MKKLFYSLVLLMTAGFCYAQQSSVIERIESFEQANFMPHLVDKGHHFEVGLGPALSSGGIGVTLHGGYYLTHRIKTYSELTLGKNYNELSVHATYNYEAIPSLRGGFYFHIGLSTGLGMTTGNGISLSPLLGPTIGVSHHFFERWSIGVRATANALYLINSDWLLAGGSVALMYKF